MIDEGSYLQKGEQSPCCVDNLCFRMLHVLARNARHEGLAPPSQINKDQFVWYHVIRCRTHPPSARCLDKRNLHPFRMHSCLRQEWCVRYVLVLRTRMHILRRNTSIDESFDSKPSPVCEAHTPHTLPTPILPLCSHNVSKRVRDCQSEKRRTLATAHECTWLHV